MTKIPASVFNRGFPPGLYRGEINDAKMDQTDDGTRGSVVFQLRENTSISDNTPEPGARAHTVRIPLWITAKVRGRPEQVMVLDIDPKDEETEYLSVTNNRDQSFVLRNAYTSFCELAIALGVGEEFQDGSMDIPDVNGVDGLEAFVEDLKAGEYDGELVDFSVRHSPNKNNPRRPYVNTSFLPPEEEEEGEGAEPEEPEEEEGSDDDDEGEEEDDEGEDDEEEEEEEEEEEPKPAPRKRTAAKKKTTKAKSAVSRARKTTKKAAKKTTKKATTSGSGKRKFTRKK